MVILDKKQKSEIVRFISERENPDGGFGIVPIIPPDLEDTFYALQTLRDLDSNSISDKTKQYLLKTAVHGPTDSFRISYHLAKLFSDYNLGVLPESWLSKPAPQPQRTIELYYYILFTELVDKKIELDSKGVNFLTSQTPESLEFLPEVSRYVLLMDRLGLSIESLRFITWVQATQWFDGGFGPIRNTTTFLEYTYDALRALLALNAKPLDAEKCREFISRCYINKDGGFGRQSRTVPVPQYTYYAVKSLQALQSMI